MRKRQLKKFAKNARKNMTPYRQAHGKGSKKDCRRLRAFNRLSRSIRLEHLRKLEACQEALNQVDAQVPSNDPEAAALEEVRSKIVVAAARHTARINEDREAQERSESFRRMLTAVRSAVSSWKESVERARVLDRLAVIQPDAPIG